MRFQPACLVHNHGHLQGPANRSIRCLRSSCASQALPTWLTTITLYWSNSYQRLSLHTCVLAAPISTKIRLNLTGLKEKGNQQTHLEVTSAVFFIPDTVRRQKHTYCTVLFLQRLVSPICVSACYSMMHGLLFVNVSICVRDLSYVYWLTVCSNVLMVWCCNSELNVSHNADVIRSVASE